MKISKELVDILVCPKCKGNVELSEDESTWLVCDNCQLKYPVSKDIPVMLIDNAIKINSDK